MIMSLQEKIMIKMKEAMKSKDKVALESLRAIKSEILLAQTKSRASENLTEDTEIKLLQKLVKQRKIVPFFIKNREEMIWLNLS